MAIKPISNFNPNDLIKFLNQEAVKDYQYNVKKDFFNAGMAFMLACVRKYFNDRFDIAIRDNNGWISVKDELPTDDEFVLLLKDDGDVIIDINHDWLLNSEITHWQPLPRPPCFDVLE